MSRLDRATVVEALRVDEVLDRLGICARPDQRWRGRWLRGRRCARTDHNSDAFGINGAGFWHCWSCDEGGDLIDLVAASENLDAKNDFPAVLERAAQIAGVEPEADYDPFAPTPTTPRPKRPPLPPPPPVEKRVEAAKARAAWAWERLYPAAVGVEAYLRSRGLDPAIVLARETVKSTPLRIEDALRRRLDANDKTLSPDLVTLWRTMGIRRGTLAIAVPVRSVDGRGFVDLRARRVEPPPGMPKIMSMVGNITVAPAERGKTRRLIGCYGDPSSIDSDTVVLTEGLMDYLTGLQLWPNAQVLGAPEAGTLGILAEHAAAQLAERGGDSRLLIVEQADPPRLQKGTGKILSGAADAAINEDHNSAAKEAIRLLGPRRVGWLYCSVPNPSGAGEDVPQEALGGKPVKDLNDLVRCGIDVAPMIAWWSDLGPPA